MLDKLEFALIVNRRQKNIGIELDSDLVAEMYYIYYKAMCEIYDKYNVYNLFELVSLLDKQAFKIECEINKKTIVQIMVDKEIDVSDEACNGINWYCRHIRYDDYAIVVKDKQNKKIADICEDDVIRINSDTYTIMGMEPYFKDDQDEFQLNLVVSLYNMSNDEEETYTADEFMMLFEDETTTYLHNKMRDRRVSII